MGEVPSRPPFSLPLTRRELQFARLYADGYSHKAIALELHVTLANVEGAIHRAKVKYRNAGHDVHTKSDMRERLVADGLLSAVQGEYTDLIAQGHFTAAQAHNHYAKTRALYSRAPPPTRDARSSEPKLPQAPKGNAHDN